MEPAATAEGGKRGGKDTHAQPVEGSDITANLQSSGPVYNIRRPGGAAALGPALSCPSVGSDRSHFITSNMA